MESKSSDKSKKKIRKRKNNLPIIILAVIVIIFGGFLAKFIFEYSNAPSLAEYSSSVESLNTDNSSHKDTIIIPIQKTPVSDINDFKGKSNAGQKQVPLPTQVQSENFTQLAAVEPNSDISVDPCVQSSKIVKDFFISLDSKKYIKAYNLDKPSEEHFIDLIQNLVNNPPVVSKEKDDLFTILQNTAHFFRIIGKKNIFLLKAILDHENDHFEFILSHFFSLTQHPQCMKEHFNLTITDKSLYEYAGFFINTEGGRSYLFRRDSVSRLAVIYYSVFLINKANQNGDNFHGLDIKSTLHNLIPEIESSTRLSLKDTYLEQLYNIENTTP